MIRNHIVIIYFSIIFFLNIRKYKKNSIIEIDKRKPDLIINNITYERTFNRGVAHATYNFVIEIKNIGDDAVNNSFYISNTRNKWDLENNHYSHSQIINYNKKIINPGEIFIDQVQDIAPDDTTIIKFKIATDGKIDEKDISNNYYFINLGNTNWLKSYQKYLKIIYGHHYDIIN